MTLLSHLALAFLLDLIIIAKTIKNMLKYIQIIREKI